MSQTKKTTDEAAKTEQSSTEKWTSEIVNMKGMKLGDQGAIKVAKRLKYNSHVLEIDLQSNEIGRVGVVALADALKRNCVLQKIRLNDNLLDDEGARHLLEALQTNKTLKALEVGDKNFISKWLREKIDSTMATRPCADKEIDEFVRKISAYTEQRKKCVPVWRQVMNLLQKSEAADGKASEKAAFDMLKALPRHDAYFVWKFQCDESSRRTLLLQSARFGATLFLKQAIKEVPYAAKLVDENGFTALHVAAKHNRAEWIRAYLDSGELRRAYIDLWTTNGRTPLHVAAQRGNVEATLALCEGGANLEATDGEAKRTPLLLAVHNGASVECVRTLLDNGANYRAKGRDSKNALELARARGDSGQSIAEAILATARQRAEQSYEEAMRAELTRFLTKHASLNVFGAEDFQWVQESDVELTRELETIRSGEYVVGAPSVLDRVGAFNGLAFENAWLYRALAYVSTPSHICSDRDVLDALSKYEASLSKRKPSPLFLLAHARLSARQAHLSLQQSLLRAFHTHAEASAWLTSEEKKAIDEGAQVYAADSLDIGARTGRERAPVDDLMAEWNELKPKLSKSQRQPMEELLGMIGLDSVKREALSAYQDALADAKLKEKGIESAAVQRALNFAFVGSPGTGKTTVARIFATLLCEAGARRGSKFVQMTAAEALRMGAHKFANELASLTGGRKNIGPPPKPLRKGNRVMVKMEKEKEKKRKSTSKKGGGMQLVFGSTRKGVMKFGGGGGLFGGGGGGGGLFGGGGGGGGVFPDSDSDSSPVIGFGQKARKPTRDFDESSSDKSDKDVDDDVVMAPSNVAADAAEANTLRSYPATIIRVNPDGSYNVEYTDGSEDTNVHASRVEAIALLADLGGVFFLDEAYDLDPSTSTQGRAILSELMAAAEEHRDTLTIILAGYESDLEEKLFAFNSGMASRFHTVRFEDFDEAQLGQIWESMCERSGWRTSALVTNVARRRLARRSGAPGFGNARDVRKMFEMAVSAAKRRFLTTGKAVLDVTDIIGPRPDLDNVPALKAAIDELNEQVGLADVKEQVAAMVRVAKSNYERELNDAQIDELALNRLFLGNPGTGKTTVAKIYGRILKALHLLSNGEVVYKTASDFVGDHVGASQQKTRVIIENARGKVLVIDEAYVLDDNGYGAKALDTLVEKVSGAPGEDIAVLMLGYEAPMLKMLRDQNAGLARRFNPHSAFRFADFTDVEMLAIIGRMCQSTQLDIVASIDVKLHAVRLLAKRRRLPNFGNAGAAKTLLSEAKKRMVARIDASGSDDVAGGGGDARELLIEDLEASEASSTRTDPFQQLKQLQCPEITRHFEELALQIKARRQEGCATEDLVGHYVFTGAPGTGKTTVARLMATILYSFDVLASDNVVETSGTDMSGQYLGESKEKVRKMMEAARGGVLFIDEAYELGQSSFGKEAMTKLLSMLTEPEYMDGNTVVILAGYEEEIHAMLERNVGLKSRFSAYLHFDDWSESRCAQLVFDSASRRVPTPIAVDENVREVLEAGFVELRQRPGWANARDAIALYKCVESARNLRVARGDESETSAITAQDARVGVTTMLKRRPVPRHDRSDMEAMDARTQTEGLRVRDRQGRHAPKMAHKTTEISKRETNDDDMMEEDEDECMEEEEKEREREKEAELNEGENHLLNRVFNLLNLEHNDEKVNAILAGKFGIADLLKKILELRSDMSEMEAQSLVHRWMEEAKRKRAEMEREREKALLKQLKPWYACHGCNSEGDRAYPCTYAPYIKELFDPKTQKRHPVPKSYK